MGWGVEIPEAVGKQIALLPADLQQRIKLQLAFIAQFAETSPPPDERWWKLAGEWPPVLHVSVRGHAVRFVIDASKQKVCVIELADAGEHAPH